MESRAWYGIGIGEKAGEEDDGTKKVYGNGLMLFTVNITFKYMI